MIIYKTVNLLNNKFYIGKDVKNNPNYLGSGLKLKRAIKKYGIENFKKEIIECCDTRKKLNEREIFWIEKLNSQNPKIGYNISNGGDGGSPMLGKKHSEETKNKISKSNKGKIVIISEETKKKISKKLKNRKLNSLSEETKKKISEANKGKPHSVKGRKLSQEIKNKISTSKKGQTPWMKGKSHTEKSKKILSEKNKKYRHTENAKNKISEKQKIKWIIKTPSNDLMEFLGYNSFKDYVKENSLNVSVETLKSYGKNKGWVIIEKKKLNS